MRSYGAPPTPPNPPPQKKNPAVTFASQGDAHLRTEPKLNSCIIP